MLTINPRRRFAFQFDSLDGEYPLDIVFTSGKLVLVGDGGGINRKNKQPITKGDEMEHTPTKIREEFVKDIRLTKEVLINGLDCSVQEFGEFPYYFFNYSFATNFFLDIQGNEEVDGETLIPLNQCRKNEAIQFVVDLAKFNGIKITKKELNERVSRKGFDRKYASNHDWRS